MFSRLCSLSLTFGFLLSTVPAFASDLQDAKTLVNESTKVVLKMQKQPHMRALLEKAKGIFIIPEFGRGAFIVGGRGGAGVVLAKHDGRWSDPAFFGLGGVSIGAQAGGSGGSMAMLLMTNKAVNDFRGKSNFSLNAGAGLTVVNYSANSQASWGKGDIIVWSNTHGAYAGATVSASDVGASTGDNHAFYHRTSATPGRILDGQFKNASADKLVDSLPA